MLASRHYHLIFSWGLCIGIRIDMLISAYIGTKWPLSSFWSIPIMSTITTYTFSTCKSWAIEPDQYIVKLNILGTEYRYYHKMTIMCFLFDTNHVNNNHLKTPMLQKGSSAAQYTGQLIPSADIDIRRYIDIGIYQNKLTVMNLQSWTTESDQHIFQSDILVLAQWVNFSIHGPKKKIIFIIISHVNYHLNISDWQKQNNQAWSWFYSQTDWAELYRYQHIYWHKMTTMYLLNSSNVNNNNI